MKRYPIALKLLLLAGVPVLGALLLAGLVVGHARAELRRGEALGSVESLAELSQDVSTLVYRLELERATLALQLGANQAHSSDGEARALPLDEKRLIQAENATNDALATLRGFLATRDTLHLPGRLKEGLAAALHKLEDLKTARADATGAHGELLPLLDYYGQATRRLIEATAGLSELTDDGELLRSISVLVAVLELEERASAEQALMVYAFQTGDYPPGAFRVLMTLLSEEQTIVGVLRTNATSAQFSDYQRRLHDPRIAAADAILQQAIAQVDGELSGNAAEYDAAQGAKVALLRELEENLNRSVRARALAKLEDTRRAFTSSSFLVGAALLSSALLALFIGRGVTRNVHLLRDAANRVARGAIDVRVELKSKDELATLGEAFNEMTGELGRARDALREQARMARDLEIAASIQAALLPPSVAHPELEFTGRMRPADEVGGDFYDVLFDERSRALWVTIGDVSGHGVPAGLVMLMTQSAFAAYFRANPLARPDEVIRGVNDLLSEQIGVRLRDDKYVTGLLLTHAGAGRFVYAGAHEWPLVWRAQTRKAEMLEAPGPWLGINRELEDIPVSSLNLAPGDILCLYSDGLIEARDQEGRLFDMQMLGEALEHAAEREEKLDSVADSLMQAVNDYAYRREDDWTLLLIRRTALAEPARKALT